VIQTNDGGYLFCGYSYYNGSGPDYGPAFVMKTDAQGQMEWSEIIGYLYNFYKTFNVRQTDDGGYILTGYKTDFAYYDYDVYLVRLDETGQIQWEKTFSQGYHDYGRSMAPTSDNGYMICGYAHQESWDIYLIKTDIQGNEQWSGLIGKSDDEKGFSIQQTTDQGFIICGQIEAADSNASKILLIKSNSLGEEIWRKEFGGEGNDTGYSVQQTADLGFIICGTTASTDSGDTNLYLVKTDQYGNVRN